MSRFLSPKYLKYSNAGPGREIETDRACRSCGYNLRGLRRGGNCPECGVPIFTVDDARSALVDAPLPVIRQLRTGFILMIVCLPLLPALPISLGMMRAGSAPVTMVFFGLSIIWVLSVWISTPVIEIPAGAHRGFTSNSRLRTAARWLQLGWPMLAGVFLLMPVIGVGAIAAIGGIVGMTAGIAGLVCLSVLLGRLAEWCCDDFAQRAYNIAAFGLGICYPGLLVAAAITPMRLLACSLFVLWLFALGSFFFGTASLGRAVYWAAVISKQRFERDRRLAANTTPGPASRPQSRAEVPLAEPEPEPRLDLPPMPGAETP